MEANYSFLFWDIYDAELYSTSNKYNSNELAIILKYNRSIDKETLIRETINDIKEQKIFQINKKKIGKVYLNQFILIQKPIKNL